MSSILPFTLVCLQVVKGQMSQRGLRIMCCRAGTIFSLTIQGFKPLDFVFCTAVIFLLKCCVIIMINASCRRDPINIASAFFTVYGVVQYCLQGLDYKGNLQFQEHSRICLSFVIFIKMRNYVVLKLDKISICESFCGERMGLLL